MGTKVISEPEGWRDIIFNLECDLTYWSLIENFELPLIFYGITEGKDGGYNYLKSARDNGVNTVVTLGIKISFDGENYRRCYNGRIDLSTAKEIIFRSKIQADVIRSDVWSIFMNKKSTPIDLLSTKDVYGNTRLSIPRQELNLPSQVLIRNYAADVSVGGSLLGVGDNFAATNGKYGSIDCDEETLTEIQTKYSLPTGLSDQLPSNLFEIDEEGDYYFDVKFEISLFQVSDAGTYHAPPCQNVELLTPTYYGCADALGIYAVDLDYYIQINNEPAIKFSKSADIGSGGSKSTVFQVQQNFNLLKGDAVYIYAKFSGNLSHIGTDFFMWVIHGKSVTNCEVLLPLDFEIIFDFGAGALRCRATSSSLSSYVFNFIPAPSGTAIPSYINAIGNTITPSTTCDTVLLHDAGLSICDRMLGKDNSFYSDFFGGFKSAIKYPSNGCGYLNALTRGINIRAYSFSEKPFTLNHDDWWNGVNPAFNLGLGYEGVDIQFLNNYFAGTLTPWLQHGDPSFRETWAWISNGEIDCNGSLHGDNFRDSYYLHQVGEWDAESYFINITGYNNSTGADAATMYCQVFTSNDGFVTPVAQGGVNNIALGYFNLMIPFTLTSDWDDLGIVFAIGAPGNVLKVKVSSILTQTVIRVEKREDFFNPTPSVYLTGVNDIQVEFDENLFTKTIEIGCEQWQAESVAGIDDAQTKHIYNLPHQLFGKDEKQLSKFILASLAWEQTRRLGKVQSQDWRLDENTFMVALSEQDTDVIPQTSPPTLTEQPELISSGVTGLNHSNTRYNVRHTPARFLGRAKKFYSGQMQSYLTDLFKYSSGEGNVLMQWTGDGGCDSGTLKENQDQSISSDYLFLPIVYSFTHPLTWDQYNAIRSRRKQAISISWKFLGVTHTKIAFIKKLEYKINQAKADFQVWIR